MPYQVRVRRREALHAARATVREAGLSEIVEPAQSQISADVSAGLEWATMEYLYDLTQEYYQVISETTTYANALGAVAQAISAPVAGEAATSTLLDDSVKV